METSQKIQHGLFIQHYNTSFTHSYTDAFKGTISKIGPKHPAVNVFPQANTFQNKSILTKVIYQEACVSVQRVQYLQQTGGVYQLHIDMLMTLCFTLLPVLMTQGHHVRLIRTKSKFWLLVLKLRESQHTDTNVPLLSAGLSVDEEQEEKHYTSLTCFRIHFNILLMVPPIHQTDKLAVLFDCMYER